MKSEVSKPQPKVGQRKSPHVTEIRIQLSPLVFSKTENKVKILVLKCQSRKAHTVY